MSQVNPEVKITLGGQERTLRMDINAMVKYEEVTGINITKIDMNNVGVKELRALLWVCLLHGDKALSLEDVGGWITMSNIGEVARSITEAFKQAAPKSEAGEAGGDSDPLSTHPTG